MLEKLVKFLDDRYNNSVVHTRSEMIQRDLAALWLVLVAVATLFFFVYIFLYSVGMRCFVGIIFVLLMTLWALSTLFDK